MPRVRIESDGTANGTRVLDADTGEAFRQARAVEWVMNPDDGVIGTAIVTFAQVPIDVVGEAALAPDLETAIQMLAQVRAGVAIDLVLAMPSSRRVRDLLGQLSGPASTS